MKSSTRSPAPVLKRIDWVQGSRLTKRDLADAIAHEARMLELHVATVHATWGVAFGLRLAVGGDLRSVRVGPGSAYTARGESVVLPTTTTIPGPTGAGTTFDLLISPPSSPQLGCCEPAVTCTGSVIAIVPTFRWSASPAVGLASDVKLGAEIPLGRYTRAADGSLSGLDESQRRTVTSLARPHVATAIADGGTLVWQQTNVDLYTTVDTSSGGFTATPNYYVAIASAPDWSKLVGPFLRIEQRTATSFVARLLFGASPGVFLFLPGLLMEAAAVQLLWVGVESTSGCPPTFATAGGSIFTTPSLGSTP